MTLIDKKSGGHRGIGNLTSTYRVWSKARRPWAQRWEDEHQRPYFAASRGVGPIDAVYRQALRHEAAAAEARDSVVILDDLESFYETINREVLVKEAQVLNFPLVILRASLAAYVGPRMLTLDGRASKELHAQNGILPGCTFATTYVKLFYLRRLDAVAAELPPEAVMDIYIDDVAIAADGDGSDLIEAAISARDAVRKALTADLGCRIAEAKTRVVASSSRISRAIADRLGIGQAVRRCAPNLGIDITAGAQRRILRTSNSTRRKRLSNCGKRSRKLAKIASTLGRRAVRVFAAGIAPEANYGVEVWGISDAESTRLKRGGRSRPQAVVKMSVAVDRASHPRPSDMQGGYSHDIALFKTSMEGGDGQGGGGS